MSNPLSNVPPPSALPSFVAQAAPQPPPTTSAPPASIAPYINSTGPPHPGAPLQPPSTISPPPTSVTQHSGHSAPPHSWAPAPPPAPGPTPPLAASAPTAGGPPPPPPAGSGSVPLSAAAAGHLSRPRYVAPPDLATTGNAGPAPLYQTGAVTGTPVFAAAPPGGSVMSIPVGAGATVDYAQTPMAAPPSAAAVPAGGEQGDGWLGWLKDTVQKSEVLSKVAERARTSMDSMITTLDPQMKDLIYSGGDLDIVVASDKEVKVSAVREAFQTVFGKATVYGVPAPGGALVPQPVGWQGARAAADARLQQLRGSGLVPAQQAVVAVEGFIVQLQPERWYDMSLLLLDDPSAGSLTVYTQPTEVPEQWVQRMEASTAGDHPQRWAGLQLTVGQVASETLQVSPSAWHETVTGLTRRELLLLAARALAYQYRSRRGS